ESEVSGRLSIAPGSYVVNGCVNSRLTLQIVHMGTGRDFTGLPTYREPRIFCFLVCCCLIYFGKFIRCMRSWKRRSERRLSILRSALKKYERSDDLSWTAFSKYSKALSLFSKPA